MAVVDAFVVHVDVPAAEKCLRRSPGRRQRLHEAVLLAHVIGHGESLPCSLLRDDGGAAIAEVFVAADMIKMPVRVEQRTHAIAARQIRKRFDQRGREPGVTAVDHHAALRRAAHQNIAACAGNQVKSVTRRSDLHTVGCTRSAGPVRQRSGRQRCRRTVQESAAPGRGYTGGHHRAFRPLRFRRYCQKTPSARTRPCSAWSGADW